MTSYNAPQIAMLDVVDGDDGFDGHNNVAEVTLMRKNEKYVPRPL